MRIPSAFRERRTSVELQLTPMIDCVFLLMIYFLWSSNFQTNERSLVSRLSSEVTAGGNANARQPPPSEADFENLVVRVMAGIHGPTWSVNDSPVATLEGLRQTLASIANIKADAPVIIDPGSGVPLGDVIDVFDVSRLVGFQKVQFAASVGPSGE